MPVPSDTGQINRVIDHIHDNLDGDLPVSQLVELTSFSRWHFHRVFSAVTGEPPAKYIARRRLEWAASLLMSDTISPVSIIAYRCGFGSVSVFCRNFKRHFGMTAQQLRERNGEAVSTNSQLPGTNGKDPRPYSHYFHPRKTTIIGGKKMECNFEIKTFPELNVIYCRHRGAYDQMGPTFGKLLAWAFPRGLVGVPGHQLMSVFHDDPAVTPVKELTSDAGMIVGSPVKPDGEIGAYQIPGGLYAEGRFEIGMGDFPAAWTMMYGLLGRHGCRCVGGYHYEVYNNDRDEHPEKKWIVDIRIPVELI